MSQPTPYTPTTDFSQQEANNASGRSSVNTAALDAEFANLESTLGGLVNNIALIQRDDGGLNDELVSVGALDRNVLNLIGGFVVRGDWASSQSYALNDIVSQSGYLYLCVTDHTSSGSFVTDSAKWVQFGFKPSDGVAAAAAQTAIDAHLIDADAAHSSSAIVHGGSTVALVLESLSSGKASVYSPTFTGTPTCPTPVLNDASAKLANTAFVANAVASVSTGGASLLSLGAIFNSGVSKTGAYTVVSGDKGKVFNCSGTFTISLTGASALGNGFSFAIVNSGVGVITIDPNSSETIDGSTTQTIPAGYSVIVFCDGSSFLTFAKQTGVISVGGNTGVVTNEQIAAAATAGYGYTPVPKDCGFNTVGSFCFAYKNGNIGGGPGSTEAGSSLAAACIGGVNGGSSSTPLTGTWRRLGYSADNETYTVTLYQRIS